MFYGHKVRLSEIIETYGENSRKLSTKLELKLKLKLSLATRTRTIRTRTPPKSLGWDGSRGLKFGKQTY